MCWHLRVLLVTLAVSTQHTVYCVAAYAPGRGHCGAAQMGANGTWLATHAANKACGPAKDSCEQLCWSNARCQAWQWMRPSPIDKGSAACYLKSELGLAPNSASTAGQIIRPAPPPPPPPMPPPPPFTTTVSLDYGSSRPTTLYGYGNELCYQSLNDSVLSKAVASSGSIVGRYPGGTPSDYWHWDTGWATDLGNYEGPRPATPETWAAYTKQSETHLSIFDTNQLTMNL